MRVFFPRKEILRAQCVRRVSIHSQSRRDRVNSIYIHRGTRLSSRHRSAFIRSNLCSFLSLSRNSLSAICRRFSADSSRPAAAKDREHLPTFPIKKLEKPGEECLCFFPRPRFLRPSSFFFHFLRSFVGFH